MKVFRSPKLNTRVHRTRECTWLQVHVKGEVWELDLDDLQAPNLCRICFPNYPKLRVFHGKCKKCHQRRALPCPHNGAVEVWVAQRDGRTKRDPGDPQGQLIQRRWVWPENAHHYELVDLRHTLVNS